MPPQIIPFGYAQITVHQSVIGAAGEIVNVFGVGKAAEIAPADAAEIVFNSWRDSFLSWQTNELHLMGVTCRSGAGEEEGFFGGDEHGVGGNDPLPLNVAVLIKKSTGLQGKAFRGRLYLCGLDKSKTAGSNLSGTNRDFAQGYADTFLGLLTAADLPMALLHSAAIPPSLVTSVTVEARLATQRMRMRD